MRSLVSHVCAGIVVALTATACAVGGDVNLDLGTDAGTTPARDSGTAGPDGGSTLPDTGSDIPDTGSLADTSTPPPDAGDPPDTSTPPDSGPVPGGPCDPNNGKYQVEYVAAAFSPNPKKCSSGCSATECCYLILCVAL